MRNTLLPVLMAALLSLFTYSRAEAAEFVATPEEEQVQAALDMYPAALLAGKGLLYKDLSEPIWEIKDPAAQQRLFAYPVLRRLIEEGSPLPVCEETDATFTLSLPAEEDSSQTRVIRVDKSALRAAGFRYISLDALRGWYERHPDRLKNALERLVPTSSGPVGPAGRTGNVLRTGPEDAAPFVAMNLPGGDAPQVRIVSRKGEWFELELYYRFIGNASSDPNVCAMALCEVIFRGFWKAPRDADGFPALFPALLRDPADWKRIAAEIGRGV